MAKPENDMNSFRWIQSCITSVSFPETIDAVLRMVEKNRYFRNWATDLDTLLEFNPKIVDYTTAPKWLTQGDILFFYHTKTAKQRIKKLRAQVQEASPSSRFPQVFEIHRARKRQKLIEFLERAFELADRYSGTIFSCAEVAGPSEYLEDEDELNHFRGRIFVPLAKVHIFNRPLSAEQFEDFVKINRQGTITFLKKQDFEGIKQQLSKNNQLPDFLKNATFSEVGFRNMNKSNWLSISCAPGARFIHEIQLRAYFLDFLLGELKDSRMPLLQECQCYRDGQRTGIADYFLKLHGRWMPIEAKLNVLSERNLSSQLEKYIHLNSFTPTNGPHRGKSFKVDDLSLCLVVDQFGVYITSDGEFITCSPGKPVWKRDQIDYSTIANMRKHLCSFA